MAYAFVYACVMKLKKDVETMLAESGWNIPRLIAESGANKDSVYRLLNGTRDGVNSSTLEKMWPFIYGDKRPPALPKEVKTPNEAA